MRIAVISDIHGDLDSLHACPACRRRAFGGERDPCASPPGLCGSEDEAIAALLHDAAEDQGGRTMLEQIRERFGAHVAEIVEACSDTMESPKPPWETRKRHYLEHLADQPPPVLRVSLADKLFNARAILREYLDVGDELWSRFHVRRDRQLWYYRQLAERFNILLPGRMATELAAVVDELEHAVIVR